MLLQGQYLGVFRRKDLNKKLIKQGVQYTLKLTEDVELTCIARVDKFSLLAIADQCASMFGFQTSGTATFKIGKTQYTCMNILELEPLPAIKDTDIVFRKRLQDYMTFRWIFGTPVTKKDIYLSDLRIVSLQTKPEYDEEDMFEEEWFPSTTKESKLRLLKGRKPDILSREIYDKIKAINPEAIIYLSLLTERLRVV